MKIYSSSAPKNDWLFTPFIAVEKDMRYELSFDIRTIGTEKYEVMYGLQPQSTAMTELLVPETQEDTDKFAPRIVEFTAKQTATIYIGFHANTTDVEKGMNLYLDNIRLKKVGTTAISSVSALAADVNLRIADGGIYVLGVDNYISVARIDGTHLFSGAVQAGQHIALEKGIYLVRTAKGTQKVVVK